MAGDVAAAFYGAFARGDVEAMVALYADDVVFEDPAFGELHGEEAADMWRMLLAGSEDLEVSHELLGVTDDTARVAWTAHYTFPSTGRHVTNEITARLRVVDGRIVDHRDDFDLHRWAGRALGPVGRLLGWTPWLRGRIRADARRGLQRYRARRA